jgi:hypothetical protein
MCVVAMNQVHSEPERRLRNGGISGAAQEQTQQRLSILTSFWASSALSVTFMNDVSSPLSVIIGV